MPRPAETIWNPTVYGFLVLVPIVALVAFGVLSIYATEPTAAAKQMFFAGVGVLVMLATLTVSYQRVGRFAYLLFAFVLVLLALLILDKIVDLPLIPLRKGARRWIVFGPVQFQPSELMKVVFILAMAKYLQFRKNYRRLGGLLGPFVLTMLPMFLILLEPDLGTVLLLFPVFFVMLFAAGARMRHFALIFVLAICALPLVWVGMEKYQQRRIVSLLLQSDRLRQAVQTLYVSDSGDTELTPGQPITSAELAQANVGLADAGKRPAQAASRWEWLCTPRDARIWEYEDGYQLNRSKAALGSGGLTGHGFDEESAVLRRQFLPFQHNDFIFAVIGHQWGLVGTLLVILCYAVIAIVGVEIASLTYDAFGRLLAVGVVTLISTQALINIGVTVGLMPITGMTLPFVSYGGSSLLVNFLAVGLLINIAQRRPVVIGPKPFHFSDDD